MGLLQFAEEIELEDFEDCWLIFRKMTASGISSQPERTIRDLHAQMSMMLSHKRIQQGHAEFNEERDKMFLDIEKNVLLHTKYNDGTVSANNAAVLADIEYNTKLKNYLNKKEQRIMMDSEVKALETAVIALSRELSARFKS